MYVDQEDLFYYITVQNENYAMPSMPEGVEEGILKGMYRLSSLNGGAAKAHLFGSGSIINESLKAQEMLAEDFGVEADVWSVTSYKQLRRDAMDAERWNLLHPSESPRVPYLAQCLEDTKGVYVMASDYVSTLPDSIARWVPGSVVSLGTDGFGRSDSRPALRNFFEMDARFITLGTLNALARKGDLSPEVPERAMRKLEIDPEKANPLDV